MLMVGVARIGNEAVVKQVSGADSLNLSLAYSYGKKGADGKYATQWVSATMWGDRCGKLAPYIHKGDQIFVELSDIKVDSFEKRDGTVGSSLKANIKNIELISSNKEKSASANNSNSAQPLDDEIPF